MAPAILYTACVLGALGLYLVIRPAGAGRTARGRRTVGALLGLGAVAFLITSAAEVVGDAAGVSRPGLFFMLFAFVAVFSAGRMITHPRPVYCALNFVLVVLASAGLFLLLEAEFMAFALIIVYAGAILITYMFVLMLAQQEPDHDHPEARPEYDSVPREPVHGSIVAFILLALLSRMIIDGAGSLAPPPSPAEARIAAWKELEALPGRLESVVAAAIDEDVSDPSTWTVHVTPDGLHANVAYGLANGDVAFLELPESAMPENIQRIGLALIASPEGGKLPKFPISLEVAGVILLMAMFGAVILARRQIELTEDEKREAVGLSRVGHHDERRSDDGGGVS